MNVTPETLAGIAARLLHEDDYKTATRKAYELLKAAEEEINMRNESALSVDGENERMSAIPERLDFPSGIRFITEENRPARAQEYFTTFLAKKTPGGKRELNAAITRYEKNGFDRWELDALRKYFKKFSLRVPQRRKSPTG